MLKLSAQSGMGPLISGDKRQDSNDQQANPKDKRRPAPLVFQKIFNQHTLFTKPRL